MLIHFVLYASKNEVNLQITNIYMHIAKLKPLEARYFVQYMDDCNNKRLHNPTLLGHHVVCYTDPIACGSTYAILLLIIPT